METKRTCFICGQPLEADAPQGLCPACLLQGAFPTGTDSGGAAPRFRPPTVEELASKFPQLELLDFVGQGGMGAVYRARQKDLDRIVALKILPPDIGKDAAFAERFMREARALARLNHPGIVTIYDFGRVDGLYFFLMEYVDGVSLRQLLGGSRLSTREALAIVPQICDALQYAHDQRIIHRDIKPENILLDRRGRVKVADFGLAKIMGSAGQGGQPEQTPNPDSGGLVKAASEKPGPETVLTDSQRVVGTPAYMSPEQREHPAEVDHRADIYALGVVFYQMLTGELPGHKLEPPSRKVEIDVRLDEVVMRALEKQPERRYRQVSEVKSQVETISSSMDTNESPVPVAEVVEPPVVRHWGWLLALGAVVGVLVLMFWRSFLPGEILFSNDRPLGQLHTDWMRLPDGLTGRWADLSYLGFNGGSEFVSFTTLLMWLLGPLGSAKFLAPLSLGVLGLCAWFAFRRLGLRQSGTILAALAVVLNSTFFSTACWGITENILGIGMSYLTLGLVIWGRQATRRWEQQTLYVLAGLASGVGILEAFEIGMLCSLVVLAYVIWDGLGGRGAWWQRLVRGVKPALWVTAFMALVVGQPMLSSFQSATGVDRTDPETRWNWATEWSLPKQEAAALVVPGLFGYRMDSPGGSQYWGGMGRTPELDEWLDGDRKEPQPAGIMRFSGGGNYLGVMVVLVALWAAVRAFRRNDAIFTRSERRWIWFWSAVAVVCLLLAFGRFAPFYRWLYALPFFNAQRNPVRFLEPMTLAVSVLFACGLLGLWRQYLAIVETPSLSLGARLKAWWREGNPHDRRWALGWLVAMVASLAAWAAYAHYEGTLSAVLGTVGFNDDTTARNMAAFSVRQVGWFVLFLALGGGLLVFIWSGLFAGKSRSWVGWLLGLLLLADLGRANRPWLVYWNYHQKYATNDVLQFLRQQPYEHRVARLPFPQPDAEFVVFDNVYAIEWLQHQFPYYDIQSLDIVQMSRMPNDLLEFKTAMSAHDSATLQRLAREWQLTNTRYLLGPVAFLDPLNDQLDPVKRRFRVAQTFDFVRTGNRAPMGSDRLDLLNLPPDRLTAVFKPHGRFAIFEFTGTLPRASLYSRWQVNTNDPVVLAQLADPAFDPQQTVLVDGTPSAELPAESTGDGGNSSVDITSYSPKEIVLKTLAKSKTVLLLNDRYDPQWTVTVDNRPATLLRCNYIMRGVQVPAGEHTVCFSFHVQPGLPLPHLEMLPDSQSVSLVFHVSNGVTSYVTLAAYGVGMVLVVILVVDRLRQRRKTATTSGSQR